MENIIYAWWFDDLWDVPSVIDISIKTEAKNSIWNLHANKWGYYHLNMKELHSSIWNDIHIKRWDIITFHIQWNIEVYFYVYRNYSHKVKWMFQIRDIWKNRVSKTLPWQIKYPITPNGKKRIFDEILSDGDALYSILHRYIHESFLDNISISKEKNSLSVIDMIQYKIKQLF